MSIHLQTTAPAAGVQIRHLRLTDLVYADDIRLMASSPEHLQALIDALAIYCATLHMEINVAKTKVMVVSNLLSECLLQWPLFSHAMASQWSMLTLSNAWACIFTHLAVFPISLLL